jgi:hypothetical protein
VAPAPEDSLDDRIAGPAALLGVLAACIVAGFWPLAGWRIAALLVSGVVGLAVVPVVAPLVPAYFRLLVPLLALAGGFSVAASVVRTGTED